MASVGEAKGYEYESGKQDMRLLTSSSNNRPVITEGMNDIETIGIPKALVAHCGKTTLEVRDIIDGKHYVGEKNGAFCEEDGRITTNDHKGVIMVSDDEDMPSYPIEDVFPLHFVPNSRHRTGSIYKSKNIWTEKYRIMDHNETWLEARDCCIRDGTCIKHVPTCMLQICSLKLAKSPVDCGSIQLYGYIAVRDDLNPLRNYVVNISRDDPIVIEKGSLINMSGPKRGIGLCAYTLIEYDMKIKTGERERDDPQLIDGLSAIEFMEMWKCRTLTERIHGDCGAVDITLLFLENAVEATVEVLISEVQSSFNLRLGCFISKFNEEIQLFDGAIDGSPVLKRSVVAAVMHSWMHLKLKAGTESSSSAEHCCSFKVNNHGLATHEIKSDFALILVKVTWSTLPWGR